MIQTPSIGMRLSCNFVNLYTIPYQKLAKQVLLHLKSKSIPNSLDERTSRRSAYYLPSLGVVDISHVSL